MFDVDTWRQEVQLRLRRFIRRPRQESALFGTDRLFAMLASRVLEPFFERYTHEPLDAVLTLGRITQLPGTTFLIHNAVALRYQQQIFWQKLEQSAEVRAVVEQIFIQFDLINYLLAEIDDIHSEWFRITLRDEIDAFRVQGELGEVRRQLSELSWRARYGAVQALHARQGAFRPEDFALLAESLSDRSAHVRAAAARQLGQSQHPLDEPLRERLLGLALYDRDVGTRFTAARAIGMLREQLADPAMREMLITCLFHEDSFVRSAACLVLAQLGPTLADPTVIDGLLVVLRDKDPYAREAAANALGSLGPPIASQAVNDALGEALLDSDQYVHEAALAALRVIYPERAARAR